MTKLKSILTLSATTLLMVGSALAGDAIDYPPLPTEYVQVGFDWEGFYAGVGIGGANINGDTMAQLDAIVGVNVTQDDFLIGAEIWLGGYRDQGSGAMGGSGGIEARAGYLFTQDVLAYAGIGRHFYDTGDQYTSIGLGTEFVVSDQVTLDFEYKYLGWSDTGNTGHSFGASALWHF
ncbi:hypothetical protein [Maritalea mediterranea]|uniref:Outer membrane protein beta-barrel domain-containing protein n=1 Tax=Maritalea mediterranea TaxID=2909667 RepID=A0ABS9E8H7_9HYPH|nr:hypothetical protein [Maritalea mediterranea]MCF4098055.1 hypothetical protein [Maritalea mediterranea]